MWLVRGQPQLIFLLNNIVPSLAENQFVTKCCDTGPPTCIKEDEKGGGRYGVWMGRKETVMQEKLEGKGPLRTPTNR